MEPTTIATVSTAGNNGAMIHSTSTASTKTASASTVSMSTTVPSSGGPLSNTEVQYA